MDPVAIRCATRNGWEFPRVPVSEFDSEQSEWDTGCVHCPVEYGSDRGSDDHSLVASYFGGTGIDAGTGIALDVNQNTYLAGETNSTDLEVSKPLQLNNGGGYDSFVTQF